MRLVLLGPPGAGKGTQAKVVAARLGIPAISTGDIFRSNRHEGTQLGLEVEGYMNRGEYVPDSVTNSMVRDRLAQPDASPGFLLDGYPRTTPQVAELDAMLAEGGTKLDHVVEITVADQAVLVARMLKRAQEQGRSDDTEDVIRRRLEIYTEETAPLARIYSERGLLLQVDGLGEVDEVTSRILDALEA
jgi:adenylate kinase